MAIEVGEKHKMRHSRAHRITQYIQQLKKYNARRYFLPERSHGIERDIGLKKTEQSHLNNVPNLL